MRSPNVTQDTSCIYACDPFGYRKTDHIFDVVLNRIGGTTPYPRQSKNSRLPFREKTQAVTTGNVAQILLHDVGDFLMNLIEVLEIRHLHLRKFRRFRVGREIVQKRVP